MKNCTIEIEKNNGDTFLAFEISIESDGTVDVTRCKNCSLADMDGDYIFGTGNLLIRIQED